MLPNEIESFAFGFDLNSASYSGGAGGSFANLVAGGEDWVINGATPSFSTKGSVEGMDFTNNAAESIIGEHRALYECTIMVVTEHSTNTYPYGGTYAAGNSFAMQINTNRVKPFNALSTIDWLNFTGGQPNVLAVSFSPFNGKIYSQANDSAIVEGTLAAGSFENARTTWPEAAIGRHRTTYYSGWVSRVLVFNRALHYRDNTSLQSLITTEMSTIGL